MIHNRRSVRKFTDEPISPQDMQELLLAGIAAPSGSNWQNQRFLPLTTRDSIERLGRSRFVWPYKSDQSRMRDAHPSGIIGHAAAVIVVFAESAENDRRGKGEYHIWEALEMQNASASIENILLLATAKGIGSCWISASDKMNYTRMMSRGSWRHLFRDECTIPLTWKLQGIIILGYPLRRNDLGYPLGEKMHGATQWMPTSRHSLEYYLPKPLCTGDQPNVTEPSLVIVAILAFSSGLIRALLFGVKMVDKLIHCIEMPLIDLKYHEKRRDQ